MVHKENSLIRGCCAPSLGVYCPLFRDYVLASSLWVIGPVQEVLIAPLTFYMMQLHAWCLKHWMKNTQLLSAVSQRNGVLNCISLKA